MSVRLKRNAAALRALSGASATVQKSFVANASKDFILTLVEIAKNILRGGVKLTRAQFQRLKRYKKEVGELVKSKASVKARRRIVQTGGFLGALVGPILQLLLS